MNTRPRGVLYLFVDIYVTLWFYLVARVHGTEFLSKQKKIHSQSEICPLLHCMPVLGLVIILKQDVAMVMAWLSLFLFIRLAVTLVLVLLIVPFSFNII